MGILVLLLAAAATVLTVGWLYLLLRSAQEDWVAAAYNQILHNLDTMEKLRRKAQKNRETLEQYHGISRAVVKLLQDGSIEKQIHKLEQTNQKLQAGNLRSVSPLAIPGYVLQRERQAIGHGKLHKTILTQCMELYGKKYAPYRARAVLAQLLSYPLFGVAMSIAVGAILIGTGDRQMGVVVLSVGTLIVLVLDYAVYDELMDSVKKRRTAIAQQFPNVVSKLALLVTSGMIMERAWRETANSQTLELYREMQKTADELDNLVEPMTAYNNFLNRCNTKETTKLASAILQNLTKGNAEIGALLKEMAHEAWQERRHSAKRASEAANSKLMIPTMMLFIAILVMLMVPVAMNFSGF